MIVITLPGQRARNFNNRTTAWMWLRKMRASWPSGGRATTGSFMEALDQERSFRMFTKSGEALVTQEQKPC